MTCNVIELMTRCRKQEGRRRLCRTEAWMRRWKRRRGTGGAPGDQLPSPLPRRWVRGLKKQVINFDNNSDRFMVLQVWVSALIPATIQHSFSGTIVVVRKLGGSLNSPLHPHIHPSTAANVSGLTKRCVLGHGMGSNMFIIEERIFYYVGGSFDQSFYMLLQQQQKCAQNHTFPSHFKSILLYSQD